MMHSLESKEDKEFLISNECQYTLNKALFYSSRELQEAMYYYEKGLQIKKALSEFIWEVCVNNNIDASSIIKINKWEGEIHYLRNLKDLIVINIPDKEDLQILSKRSFEEDHLENLFNTLTSYDQEWIIEWLVRKRILITSELINLKSKYNLLSLNRAVKISEDSLTYMKSSLSAQTFSFDSI